MEQIRIDGDDIYWIERRAQEGGRKVIVRRAANGEASDVTPTGFNVRTRVHEYGGGDYSVADGTIVFSNFTDQRLYLQRIGGEPRPLTPAEISATPTARSTGAKILFTACAKIILIQAKPSMRSCVSISMLETRARSSHREMTSTLRPDLAPTVHS